MSTIAQRNRRMAWKSARRLRGLDVIYSRDVDSIPIKVVPGKTLITVEDSETRFQLRSSIRDYHILPEDLVIGDEQTFPEPGDEITEPDGAIYRVIREIASEPAWRWSDSTKQIIRVHTELAFGT